MAEPEPELSSAQPPCRRAGLGGGPWKKRELSFVEDVFTHRQSNCYLALVLEHDVEKLMFVYEIALRFVIIIGLMCYINTCMINMLIGFIV